MPSSHTKSDMSNDRKGVTRPRIPSVHANAQVQASSCSERMIAHGSLILMYFSPKKIEAGTSVSRANNDAVIGPPTYKAMVKRCAPLETSTITLFPRERRENLGPSVSPYDTSEIMPLPRHQSPSHRVATWPGDMPFCGLSKWIIISPSLSLSC